MKRLTCRAPLKDLIHNLCRKLHLLETMSGKSSAAAEKAKPVFLAKNQQGDKQISLLEPPHQEEDMDTSAFNGQEKEEMDAKWGHKMAQQRTDHACDVSREVPSQDANKHLLINKSNENLPVIRPQHQIDADSDFWTSIITNGQIVQALLSFLGHGCLECTDRYYYLSMHTSLVAVCYSNSKHRQNKQSLIRFLSKSDTTTLQQAFLTSTNFLNTIKDTSYDLPLNQTFLPECEFYGSNVSHTTFPLYLQYADGYQLVQSSLTLQKYTFQTTTKDQIIQSHLIKPLQSLGYARRIYPASTTHNKRSVTFICIFPTEDSSYKEDMEEKINHFVDLNHFSDTVLYIHPTIECNLQSLNAPKNPIYTASRENIVANKGYDDQLVDDLIQVQLLTDILIRASTKYVKDTEEQHEDAKTRQRIATNNKTTISRAKLMFLPVSFVPLGSSLKHSTTAAVKMGSTLKENNFHFNPWKAGDVIEPVILRDQKKMEQLIKKTNSNQSQPEINKILQKWRVEQQRNSRFFPEGLIPVGKVILPSEEVSTSPILPGDTVIVFQKSPNLSGYQHFLTVPVNNFTGYLTASLSSLNQFLLTNDSQTPPTTIIPKKRLSPSKVGSNKKTTSTILPTINELSLSQDSMLINQTFIQQSNKTIQIINLYDFTTFISLKNYISKICHMDDFYFTIKNQLITVNNYKQFLTQLTTVDYYLTIYPVLKGGSKKHQYTLRSTPPTSSQPRYQDILSDSTEYNTSDSEFEVKRVTTVLINRPIHPITQISSPSTISSNSNLNESEIDTSDYSLGCSHVLQWFPDLPIRTGQEPNEFTRKTASNARSSLHPFITITQYKSLPD